MHETESSVADLLSKTLYKRKFDFEALALAVFRYQYRHNHFFREWCHHLNASPKTVTEVDDIPFLPADIFKYIHTSCFPLTEATKVFLSSGTTGKNRSLHFLNKTSYDLYARASLHQLAPLIPRGAADYSFVAFSRFDLHGMFVPKLHSAFGLLAERYADTRYVFPGEPKLSGTAGVSIEFLKSLSNKNRPLLLCGNLDDLTDVLKECLRRKMKIGLRRNSLIFTSGGFKRVRGFTKKKFITLASKVFDLPHDAMLETYSCTELTGRGMRILGKGAHMPPWWKVTILDPLTLRPQPSHMVGTIKIVDLLSFNSISSIVLPEMGHIRDGLLYVSGRKESHAYRKLLNDAKKLISTEDHDR